MIIVIWKKSKFFIFDHDKSQNGPYLAQKEKRPSKFLICCTVYGKLPEIERKLKKYWGKIDPFLPWSQNLKWTPRPLFCTQVKN